jgi:hypothetical protein
LVRFRYTTAGHLNIPNCLYRNSVTVLKILKYWKKFMRDNRLSYNQAGRIIKKDWYFQGINAKPLFLCAAGKSGFASMKKILGFNYTALIYDYKNNYCEMGYLPSDFVKIWQKVKNQLKQDKNYLKKTKKICEKNFSVYQNLFLYLNRIDIKKINDEHLLVLLKKLNLAQIDCVSAAHVIECVAVGVEKEFRKKLFKCLHDKSEFNRLYIDLTVPTKSSFVFEEEKNLFKIKKLIGVQRRQALKKHLSRFFLGGKQLSWFAIFNNKHAGKKDENYFRF